MSFEPRYAASISPSAAAPSRRMMQSVSRRRLSCAAMPVQAATVSAVMALPALAHWSSRDSASRIAPSASRASSMAASGASSMPSCCATYVSRAAMSCGRIRPKSKRWQRDRIVAGSLCTSVVAKMNSTCAGGSSSVLSRALNAPAESICTSSMIYTRYFPVTGV